MNDKPEEEQFEILELVDRGWLRRMLGDVANTSHAKQIVIGGGTGWATGYIFGKVGRVAAVALGSSFLVLQYAQHKGLININWNQVDLTISAAKEKLQRGAEKQYPLIAEEVPIKQKVVDFARHNGYLVSGFMGGFLIGVGF